MQNREYELTFIIPSDIADDAVNGVVQTVQGWVEAGAGKVVDVTNWGRRHLMYPIRDYNEGTYVLFKAELESAAIGELERNLKLSQQVIRYLLIRIGE
jgi:small subunit ribosomal protein S6